MTTVLKGTLQETFEIKVRKIAASFNGKGGGGRKRVHGALLLVCEREEKENFREI